MCNEYYLYQFFGYFSFLDRKFIGQKAFGQTVPLLGEGSLKYYVSITFHLLDPTYPCARKNKHFVYTILYFCSRKIWPSVTHRFLPEENTQFLTSITIQVYCK